VVEGDVMSDRIHKRRTGLWWVYPVDGRVAPALFSGSLKQMVAHINALHSAQGVQFGGREL
jgi:hypothetical protein